MSGLSFERDPYRRVRRGEITLLLAALAAAMGCRHPSGGTPATASSVVPSSSAASVVTGIPVPAEQIRQAVNPDNVTPYSGPTGKIHGIVTVTGDAPPSLDWLLPKIPAECPRARTVYSRLFREGMMRSLADVLVSVTGYAGYVKPKSDVVRVEAYGCAWDKRTIAVTFGQRLEIVSKDNLSYVPELLGAHMPAEMYAIPKGDAVPLYPTQVGRLLLSDGSRPTMFADVFVVKFPTVTVTGLDGRYEIDSIPVGKVDVTALLPATLVTSARSVQIEPGKDLEVNLEIPYDAAKNPSRLPDLWKQRAAQALVQGTVVPSATAGH